MLTEEGFERYCSKLSLSNQAKSKLQYVRQSNPSRRVRSGLGNVSCSFPSRKMGVTIQAESHTVELPFVYEYEHNLDILEYYDQPFTDTIHYKLQNGKNHGQKHTPDFLVLYRDKVVIEEIKTEARLTELSERQPNYYTKDANGIWRCPPGEEYARQYGWQYVVRVDTELGDRTHYRNLLFLSDYFDVNCPSVPEDATTAVLELVKRNVGITLWDLQKQVGEQVTSDHLFTLIAGERIFVNLFEEPLGISDHVHVFYNREIAAANTKLIREQERLWESLPSALEMKEGCSFLWDGVKWDILNVGTTNVYVKPENGDMRVFSNDEFLSLIQSEHISGIQRDKMNGLHADAQSLLELASNDAIVEANRRWSIITSGPEVCAEFEKPSKYSIRNWKRRYREHEEKYGFGYTGLIPLWHKSGNRTPRLPNETYEQQKYVIENIYETLVERNRKSAYEGLIARCAENNLIPPSYETFCRAIKKSNVSSSVRKRRGDKIANDYEEFFWEVGYSTPRHGDRPWEIGHIDHTEVDLMLRSSRNPQQVLGKAWLTILFDAYSRRVLAFYLTYDEPSYRSCMMVIRECVRRHGRLPNTIVVDRGPEFQSIYFDQLLAALRCTKKTRPGNPRYGSVLERLFGSANTELFHNLVGNTKIMKFVRKMTSKTDPRNFAEWTLTTLFLAFYMWAYDVYDTQSHPALQTSPREAFFARLRATGHRGHMRFLYDDKFMLLTFPTTPKGTARVQGSNRGVQVNYIHYWHSSFKRGDVANTDVRVRYNPFDMSYIYAFILGRWVKCIAEHHAFFKHRTEREISLAVAELRRINRSMGRTSSGDSSIASTRLRQYIASVEGQEYLNNQQVHDKELFPIIEFINNFKMEEDTRADSDTETGIAVKIDIELEEVNDSSDCEPGETSQSDGEIEIRDIRVYS